MDKIDKVLAKLSEKEKKQIKQLFQKIKANDFLGLDVKKLRGYNNIYRIKKGQLRIIYQTIELDKIKLVGLSRRSENIYKKKLTQ